MAKETLTGFREAFRKYIPREKLSDIAQTISCNLELLEDAYRGRKRLERQTIISIGKATELSNDAINELLSSLGYVPSQPDRGILQHLSQLQTDYEKLGLELKQTKEKTERVGVVLQTLLHEIYGEPVKAEKPVYDDDLDRYAHLLLEEKGKIHPKDLAERLNNPRVDRVAFQLRNWYRKHGKELDMKVEKIDGYSIYHR